MTCLPSRRDLGRRFIVFFYSSPATAGAPCKAVSWPRERAFCRRRRCGSIIYAMHSKIQLFVVSMTRYGRGAAAKRPFLLIKSGHIAPEKMLRLYNMPADAVPVRAAGVRLSASCRACRASTAKPGTPRGDRNNPAGICNWRSLPLRRPRSAGDIRNS